MPEMHWQMRKDPDLLGCMSEHSQGRHVFSLIDAEMSICIVSLISLTPTIHKLGEMPIGIASSVKMKERAADDKQPDATSLSVLELSVLLVQVE
jgi:hypothetical protein